MKKVFTLNNVVIGIAAVVSNNASVSSGVSGSIDFEVDDTVTVAVGWTVEEVDGMPVFGSPAAPG